MFDLEQPSTWLNIPVCADLIWCFPATPLGQVQAFARMLDAPPRRIVVLGSTSAYDAPSQSTEYPPSWIDESAPINLTKPRVQGEEFLRTNCGAIVLRVAGIYGPGRNPLDWIRQGRVSPSRKYVNLIHAEDLAAICLLALEHGKPGEVYNVSDGQPHTWNEICATAQQRWGVTAGAA
jgi:nucleoside-diphosphate-sugar epimerase